MQKYNPLTAEIYDLLKAQHSKKQFSFTAQFELTKASHVDKYVDFKLCYVTESFSFAYKEKKTCLKRTHMDSISKLFQ
jgi:hypothetical protein